MSNLPRFIVNILKEIRRQQFIKYYKNSSDENIVEIVSNMKKTKQIDFFMQDFTNKYANVDLDKIIYDDEHKLFYVVTNSHRMYFKRSLSTKEKVAFYYRTLLIEQDPESPHCYESSNFHINKGDIVLDAGVAEGNFTVNIIDKAEKCILVECDDEWVEALKVTFMQEIADGKVILIQKALSSKDVNNDKTISIDEICAEYGNINFIKMDIEGYEEAALSGAEKLLQTGVTLAVCAYHKADSEKNISEMLSKHYNVVPRKGYIVIWGGYKFVKPYARHGVLQVTPKGDQL